MRLSGKNNWNLMYYPIFLFRRIMFVAIPTFLFRFSYFQIMILLFFSSIYLNYYSGTRPHLDKGRVKIEIFNEIMIMLMNYHMACFSEFNLSIEMQFLMGYSFIACIAIMVVVNLSAMGYRQVIKLQRTREYKAIKRDKLVN